MKPQTSLPNKGNPFYNTTSNGGYSWCIQGSPTVSGLNVLDNCVGWACGRFNEVYAETTGYKGMKYPNLHCDAEYFIERAKRIGLSYQQEPTIGGIMVWEGIDSNGVRRAGHVASVEQINGDGSVLTSESGYKHFDFRNYTRYKGNGNWGLNSNFKYLGCIINPANPKPEPNPPTKFPFAGIVKKGSKLYTYDGRVYKYPASANRDVEVLGEKDNKYRVYGDTFNPHEVYVDKGNVITGENYPFNAILKKGSSLYNANGYKYPSNAKADRQVKVLDEVNERYKIYGSTFTPHEVYCNKNDIKR